MRWSAPAGSSLSNSRTTGPKRRLKRPPQPQPKATRKSPTPEGVSMPRSEPMVLMRRAPSGLRRGPLDAFAHQLRERVTAGRWFQCLITDDRELQRLNRQFLGKDYPADVLSFPAAENAETPAGLGEIAISYQR